MDVIWVPSRPSADPALDDKVVLECRPCWAAPAAKRKQFRNPDPGPSTLRRVLHKLIGLGECSGARRLTEPDPGFSQMNSAPRTD